jgi:hypothetical protein
MGQIYALFLSERNGDCSVSLKKPEVLCFLAEEKIASALFFV